MIVRLPALFLLITLVMIPARTARSSTADVFGLGATLPALAGSGSALYTDPWAAHHAPAALAFASTDRLSLGVTGLGSELRAGGERLDIKNPLGLAMGYSLVRRFHHGIDWAIAFGLVAFVLPDTAGHVIQRSPDTPLFLLYDNRTQRDMLVAAMALGLGQHVSVGVSVDLFAGLTGPVSVHENRTGDVQTSMFVDIVTRIRPTPSIVVRPGLGLSIALTYHPAFHVPYDLDVDVDISGLELSLDVQGRALFTPHALVLGLAWSGPDVNLTMDVSWSMWSRMGSPFVQVETRLMQVGLLTSSSPAVDTRDTVSVRAGVEGCVLETRNLSLILRAGYGWESPAVGPQTGRTNVFDGHKHTLAMGFGVAWLTSLPGVPRILLDMHVGAVVVSRLTHHKVVSDPAEGRDDPGLIVDEDEDTPGIQITNPGYPTISGSGHVFTSALTLTLELG